MATTKKSPTAKSATVRKSATKTAHKNITKPSAKTAHKPTAKKALISAQSFRPSKESAPFMTFTFTLQSLYWLILSVLVLALGAWVMYLNVKIQDIYDQVELNTQQSQLYMMPTEKKVQQ